MSSPAGSPTIAENIRALSRAQKSKAGAPLYSRIINRPAGRVLQAGSWLRSPIGWARPRTR